MAWLSSCGGQSRCGSMMVSISQTRWTFKFSSLSAWPCLHRQAGFRSQFRSGVSLVCLLTPHPPILWLPGELSFKLFSRALVAAGLKETGWLGLMSPPAGHPDPAASSSQSLSLTLTAAAVTPAAVSQDPESPGEETCPDRQHSACVAPVGSLLLDSPHTLPLRKQARDVEANPLLCCCPLGTFP